MVIDTRLAEIATTMARLSTDNTFPTDALGTQVAAMSATQKTVEHQRETAIRTLAERFGDRKIKDAKYMYKNKHSLAIPANLQTGKSKQPIENLRTFTKAELERFAFVMAEFNRTINDYDQKNQAFYKPPTIPAELEKIDATSQSFYTADAKVLYDEVWVELSDEVKTRLKGTFNYGFGASKLSGTVTKGDGPTLIFAMICMFRPCVGAEEDIVELFCLAHKAFKTHNNPMTVVNKLRPQLVEATELHTEFKWSQSGAKIVEALCHGDHNMSEELELYENITPPDNQVTSILANLFAAIERQCTKEVQYDNNTPNKRTNQATGVFGRLGLGNNKKPKKECRDGRDCKRGDCHFSHPQGKWNEQKDSKPRYDNSNKTGGKYEAANCPEVNQKKQLCTLCFYKMLDDGSIKTKAGGKIEKSEVSHKRPTQKHDQRKPWQPRSKKNANAASSTINVKAIEKAWVKSGKRTRNDDDDYI